MEGKRKKGELWVEGSLKEGTEAALANSTEVSRQVGGGDRENLPCQGCPEFAIYRAPASHAHSPDSLAGQRLRSSLLPEEETSTESHGNCRRGSRGHKAWGFVLFGEVDLPPCCESSFSCFTMGNNAVGSVACIVVSLI